MERGDLLEDLFRLPFEFAVPDLLFVRELAGDLGDRLTALGLRVEELSPAELIRATTIRRQRVNLSTPDTFAFAIAESRKWTLLTGDGGLCELATSVGLEMHGVLWIFDQLADGNHIGFGRLHAGLTTISSHPRCRLPATEVRRRLNRFSP